LPGARVENSPSFANRKRDIASWQVGKIGALSSREKKRYLKRKSAIKEYFTTDAPPEEIALQHHISTENLLELAEKCTMQHRDGKEWGFRALMPGVKVVDYPVPPAAEDAEKQDVESRCSDTESHVSQEEIPGTSKESSKASEAGESSILVDEAVEDEESDTAKHEAINLSSQHASFAMAMPETPFPEFADGENEEGSEVLPEEEQDPGVEVEQPAADEQQASEEEQSSAHGAEPVSTEEPAAEAPESDAEEETQGPTEKLAEHVAVEDIPAEDTLETPVNAEDTVNLEATSDQEQAAASESEADKTLDIMAEALALEDQISVNANEAVDQEAQEGPEAEDENAEVERTVVERQDVPKEDEDTTEGDVEEEEERFALAKVTRPITAVAVEVAPLVVPISSTRTYTVPKRAVQRRLVRKRWQRDVQGHSKNKRILRIVSMAAVVAMLLFVLVPVGVGMAAYGAYNNISGIAHDGVNHLLKVKDLLNVSKTDYTSALDATKLSQAQVEFKAAESDFTQLQQLVNRPDVQGAITQFAPQYSNTLVMAQSLIQVAMDVSRMGDELSGIALIGANIIHGSPLAAGSTKPLLSTSDVEAIEGSMVHALYYITDIRMQMSNVSIKDLPISNAQKNQIASLMPLLPKAQDMIVQAQGLVGLVTWLLGVGQPRRFLIQTMDSAELRPGGGFTGQYGILQIQDGRMSPLSLTDVTIIDYAGNGTAIGRTAPPGYSWMNFGNWGVRDSNLSGDFPTTARMTMQLFQDEGGGPLDGNIAFTPKLIGNILDVTGPIKVPGYNETITSKNLEERLHYYQQDFSAIAREKAISGNYTHAGRKAFTSTLAKMLLDRVRHLKPTQLIAVGKSAIKSIQSRDLEIYFANPAAENWLVNHGYSSSIDTFAKQDGFAVVQANISISKASQYVHTTEHDDITLDASGGATHNLTITLDYQQKGPVYGFDTYADYIRVYAPKGAQLQGGSGFDSGHAICKPGTTKGTPTPTPTPGTVSTGCSQYDSSFNGARYCPNGNYSLGLRGGLNTAWTVDSLGPPTALTSDLPSRAMWGGLTETPKDCTSTITVSWYVPHEVQKVNGQPAYTLLVQKQSGYSPTIELNIDASAVKGLKNFTFKGDITADKAFILVPPPKKH